MSLKSMTGHGVGEAPIGAGRVLVELRAVNHRFLDARVRLPSEVVEHVGAVEECVRKSLRRGRVEVLARIEGSLGADVQLDVTRARAAFEQLCALRDELRPDADVPLSLLSAVPELFGAGRAVAHDDSREALVTATEAACDALWEMRRIEGEALAADLLAHLTALETELSAVRARAPEIVEEYRTRLRARIDKLLQGSDVPLDQGRLEHEVAMFADRADIAEELARLASHCGQLRGLLEEDDGDLGKRLDFLLQEMNREANTIGSKCSDADLARRVVEMKAAIHRMREQAQNVL